MKAYLREKRNAKTYYCILKWTDENGTPQTKEVTTGITIKGNNKRLAKQKVEEIRKEYENKIEVQRIVPCDKMSFDEYLLSWLEKQKSFLKPTTYYGYEGVINKHIIPYFKPLKVSLSDLTSTHIQSYYNKKLEEGLSANTVKHHHANIRKALQEALRHNLVPCNMADRTTLPSIIKYKPKVYNKAQVLELLKAIKNTPLESVVMICMHYALRRGEVCGLRWSDIDFENRIMYIQNTRTSAKTEIFQQGAKTESSIRQYPLSDMMLNFLLDLQAKQKKNKLFFGTGYIESGFLCTWDDGKPLGVSYVSHAFATLLKNNGLPHIRFHDIRHTVATNLLDNGIDLKIIQEYLGHSTMATTANFYLHPDIKQKAKALNVMNELIYNEA